MNRQHAPRTAPATTMIAAFLILVAVGVTGAAGRHAIAAPIGEAPPDGAQLFRTYCASCHGVNATGNGPAAAAMKRTPPDLTRMAGANGGVFPAERVRQIIVGKGPAAHGERTMPVWGDVFARRVSTPTPAALVDALVRYLNALQQRPA
jgi:mono/diheme cytochrome c family protein